MTRPIESSGHRIAAIVAHADDEVLGCGGTLRRHADAGDEVWTIILADGETSRDQGEAGGAVAGREMAARAAAAALGVRHVEFHRFPDNRLDTKARLDIAKAVEKEIGNIQPDIVYTHHAGDLNVDHRRVHEAVVIACRPVPGHPVRRLLFFETASSTEWQTADLGHPFVPNWFVDVSAVLDIKMSALKSYDAEMRPWPHPRSYQGVEHLARWRGATVGCMAAEAFMLGREIER